MIKSGLAWNKGRKVGQKRALRPQDVWMIRGRLRAEGRKRDLALFNLAIDSKLSACDLVALQVKDVCHHRVHRSSANTEGASQRSGEAPQGECAAGPRWFYSELATGRLGTPPLDSRVGVFRFRADPVILIRPDPPFDYQGAQGCRARCCTVFSSGTPVGSV